MTHSTIVGAGEYRPETIRKNSDWPEEFAARQRERKYVLTRITTHDGDPCAAIVRRHAEPEAGDPFLGTRERRVAASHETSCEAQARAAEQALADAGLAPSDIDVVLSQAHPPDRPGLPGAPWIMSRLGVRNALGLDVDSVCASAVNQLLVASAMIQSGQARHVLITQGHLVLRATPQSHPASPNVGDLATAIVVGRSEEPGILAHHTQTDGDYARAFVWLRDGDAHEPWWEGGGPFRFGSLDAAMTEDLIARTVQIASNTLVEACNKAGIAPSDIRLLCSVQPRRWIPAAIAEAAGIPEGRAPNTFTELAHVGACGVVANLLAARRAKSVQRGDVVALYAQGAGFTRSAALLRWTRPQ